MKSIPARLACISALIMLATVFPKQLSAQSYYYQFGSTVSSDYVAVPGGALDASNGNLHIEIPMVSIPQRGSSPYTATLVYDSHIWQQALVSGSKTWQPTNIANSNGGWRLESPANTGSTNYQETDSMCTYGRVQYPQSTFNNFTWQAPDGHVRRFAITTTQSAPCTNDKSSANALATDGSGYRMYVTGYTSVSSIYAPDGTRVYPSIEDANGNYYGTTDTLGRTPITASVLGANTTYNISNAPNISTYSQFTMKTESIPVDTSFGQSGVTECATSCTITVVSELDLPDGSFYKFGYDQGSTSGHYGLLTSMQLPTGATINYTHQVFKDAYNNFYLYLATAGGTPLGSWSYTPLVITPCGTTCSQQLTISAPSSDAQVLTFTMYSGTMWNTLAKYYTGSAGSGTLLETVQTDYNTTGSILPIRTTTTLPIPGGSIMKKTEVSYDTNNYGDVIAQLDWRFYSGSFGSQDRKTLLTYLANSNNNMVNKKQTMNLYPGTSLTPISTVTVNYDASATSLISGVVQHDDTNFGVSYTPRGNPTSIVNNSSTKYFSYDMTGQITTSQDQKLNVTQYSYGNNFFDDGGTGPIAHSGSPGTTNAYVSSVTLTAPFGWTLTAGYYWGDGKMAKLVDQNGQTANVDYYDPLDRNTRMLSANGSWLLREFTGATVVDNFNGITTTTPGVGCSSCADYKTTLDTLGRTTTQSLVNDPENADKITLSYDLNGRTSTRSNPYRSTSDPSYGYDTYSYDGLNRVTSVSHSAGGTINYYYGAGVTSGVGGAVTQLCSSSTYGSGYPVLTVDEAGGKREVWTDGFGRTIEVDEPDNSNNLTAKTCYTYDVLDNLLSVVQGTLTRTYTYDAMSRLTAGTTPESGNTQYFYTTSTGALCSGNPNSVCRKTDARSTTTTYTYDALNRLTGVSYSDSTPAVTYTYDAGSGQKGFSTGMSDGSGSTTWTNNSVGWVLSEQRTIATKVKTLLYAYNLDGTIATITYPSGNIVTYATSNAERSTSAEDVAHSAQYAVMATYLPFGPLGGVMYGPSGGFTGITNTSAFNGRLEPTTVTATSTGGAAQNLAYSYSLPGGNNGTISSVQNNVTTGLSESLKYDYLNRILSASTTATTGSGCWGQSFGPAGPPPPGPADDAFGNLTQINSTNCTTGSLSVTVGSTTNRINSTGSAFDAAGNMATDPSASSYGYSYDAEDRISQVTGTTGGTWNYVYDGNGMRVEKSNGASGTLYWRDPWGDTLAETDLSGNPVSEYVFFANKRIAKRDSLGNVTYYYTDKVGSTVGMTTASGTPCYDATYTPYGEEYATLTTCQQNYKFAGYERDAETGLDYAFARYYNSRLGRFMTADPLSGSITNPQTLNRYVYVANDPVNSTDPTGKKCKAGGSCSTGFASGWSDIPVYTSNSYPGYISLGDASAIPGTGTISATFPNGNVDTFTQTGPAQNWGMGNMAPGVATVNTFQGFLMTSELIGITGQNSTARGGLRPRTKKEYDQCMQRALDAENKAIVAGRVEEAAGGALLLAAGYIAVETLPELYEVMNMKGGLGEMFDLMHAGGFAYSGAVAPFIPGALYFKGIADVTAAYDKYSADQIHCAAAVPQ